MQIKFLFTFVVPMRPNHDLLHNIKQEIIAVGGRIAMGYLITTEAPGWFTISDRRYFKDHHRWNDNRRMKQGKKRRKDIWKEEDIKFVLDNFGLIKTSRLGYIIGRTATAVRLKFGDAATREQKIEAMSRTNPSRRPSIFKYKP